MVRTLKVPPSGPTDTAPLAMGDAEGTPGAIRLTTRYVERDGRPWFPVMGEYHFSRDQPERWESELRSMRAGGVNVVATYLLWILHEERRGQVRFDGHLDLRRFVEAADRAGLEVVLRIGPWAHGETRNGGFPDWLQALPLLRRTDDPAYLELVRGWYAAIEQQVRGLCHGEGNPEGPVVGIQVENELYDQPDHLRTLRRLAEEVGMHTPLWMATGWGGAQLPEGVVLPVYAGYSDGFWEESTTGWPDFGVMHYTFNTVRDDLTVGADLRDASVPATPQPGTEAVDPWPFVTCELGGGMQVAYHRRPLVDPDDVAALALTKLGSGSAWQGYYLYHGSTQVLGELSTTQESHATGYPNDLPVRDYDFYAPLGAAGAQRPHFARLRRQHLLLAAFGDAIATCPTTLPEGPDDVRWAVRGDGERGYLFVNHHQPAIAALPPVEGVQFAVELSGRTVTVPSAPFRMPTGASWTWPLRQPFGSISALTATAQPITSVATPAGPVVFFAAVNGVPVELQLEGVDPGSVRGAATRTAGDLVVATPEMPPGPACEVVVGDTTLVVLDPDSADALWRGKIDGRESIVLWRGSGWFEDGAFRVVQPGRDQTIDVWPPLAQGGIEQVPGEGTLLRRYVVPGTDLTHLLDVPVFRDPVVAPVRTGGSLGRLSAPLDEDFAGLAPVEVAVPDELFEPDELFSDAERVLLRLEWTGDVVRVYAGQSLVVDQFWYGRELEVDLTPYREAIRTSGLRLKAFAWNPDAGVYVDPRVRPDTVDPLLEVRQASLHVVRSRPLR